MLATFSDPRRSQDAPRRFQDGHKMHHVVFKTRQDAPRRSKTPPRQGTRWAHELFWMIFGGIWDDFHRLQYASNSLRQDVSLIFLLLLTMWPWMVRHTQDILRTYSTYIEDILRISSPHTQAIFTIYSAHVQRILSIYTGHTQDILGTYAKRIQDILRT